MAYKANLIRRPLFGLRFGPRFMDLRHKAVLERSRVWLWSDSSWKSQETNDGTMSYRVRLFSLGKTMKYEFVRDTDRRWIRSLGKSV